MARITEVESNKYNLLDSPHEVSKRHERMKGKDLTDLVKLDYTALDKLVSLINNENIHSTEFKELLVSAVTMISDLAMALKETYKYKEATLLTDILSDNNSTVSRESLDKMDLVRRVQDFLSKQYADLFNGAMDDTGKRRSIKEIIIKYIISLDEDKKLAGMTNTAMADLVFEEILGFSIIEEYMDASEELTHEQFVEEIRINEFNDIRIVIRGKEQRSDKEFESPEHLKTFVDKLIRNSSQQQAFNKDSPFIRLRLGDTTRVSIMRDPIARRDSRMVKGDVYHVCIRKQRLKPFSMDYLQSIDSIGEYSRAALETITRNGISVAYYGGTGTGKTGTMTAVAQDSIPADTRVLTIAEIDEMNLARIDFREYLVENGLKVRNPQFRKALNSVLMWEITNQEVKVVGKVKGFTGGLNAGLTMSPETIVLQEAKGGEIVAVMEACISDHQVLTTLHAAGPKELYIRIVHMAQGATQMDPALIMQQIPIAFPIIVQLTRMVDGTRKVTQITELINYIPQTREIKTNTIAGFEITSITLENNKRVVTGKHRAYNLPTAHLRSRMQLKGGMLDSEWQNLMSLYSKNYQAPPEYLDKLEYRGSDRAS